MVEENLLKKYSDLINRVSDAHFRLMMLDPTNSLINLINIDSESITWSEEFGAIYDGWNKYDAFSNYLNKLKQEIKEAKKKPREKSREVPPPEDFVDYGGI